MLPASHFVRVLPFIFSPDLHPAFERCVLRNSPNRNPAKSVLRYGSHYGPSSWEWLVCTCRHVTFCHGWWQTGSALGPSGVGLFLSDTWGPILGNGMWNLSLAPTTARGGFRVSLGSFYCRLRRVTPGALHRPPCPPNCSLPSARPCVASHYVRSVVR